MINKTNHTNTGMKIRPKNQLLLFHHNVKTFASTFPPTKQIYKNLLATKYLA